MSLSVKKSIPAGKTYLVVEDNDLVRNGILSLVSNQFPDSVFWEANSGEAALSLISSRQPDIILMDIGLPKMNGIEATRQIKKILPDSIIIMLTLYSDPAYKNASFTAGASEYVSKEKMHQELIPVLEKWMG